MIGAIKVATKKARIRPVPSTSSERASETGALSGINLNQVFSTKPESPNRLLDLGQGVLAPAFLTSSECGPSDPQEMRR
jgi:hypothetical protein